MGPSLWLSADNFADPGTVEWSQRIIDRAEVAEAAGVDCISVSDHVVLGKRLEEYGRPERGGRTGGRQPTGSDGEWLEPLTTLAFVAARTRSIRLGTTVLLAALRRPVVLAKAVASLDVLSRGRVELGVGIGWQREEYEAAGISYAERGALLDHTLAVCDELWRHSPAQVDIGGLELAGLTSRPGPVGGEIPVWVSGTVNPRVVARVARHGLRWITWGDALADPEPAVAAMRQGLTDAGHDPSGLRVLGALAAVQRDGVLDVDATVRPLAAMVSAGVQEFRLLAGLPEGREQLGDMLGRLMVRFRNEVGGGGPPSRPCATN